ncbi:MAG TPA: redoxin domain-containing protein [Hyphomonadaceae bacterium]|nr:redoxin domain-containing protein [Hyphomonadaceae bacterium]HPI48140.1 redoxin domain-containing protein [Hyphomonadaceae bacterium]
MKRVLLASTMALAIAGVATVIGVSAIAAPAPSITVSVPERADNFQLTDHTRLAHELHYFKDAKAIVLMSQINGSDVSRKSASELEKLKAAYKDQGVLFYMINSKDSRDAAAVEAKAQSFDIPILVDELQLVGESLGVQREGEIFVVDPKSGFKIAYHGPLAQTAAAIDSVVAGKAVANARVEVKSGATIAFPERAKSAEFKNISYSKDVTAILQDKCVTCHQKGGIAPFAMDSYDVVKTMAPMIRESVRAERMPPYFADPHIGHFQNDQGLTAAQTKTLIHWIEAGAPRGTGEDFLKTKAGEAPEWPTYLGKPDVIVDLPAFNVPAAGIVEYQNQKVPNPFTEDTWLRAISIKPGDRTVLHHVVSNHVPDPKLPKSKIPGGSVGSYTPGAEAQLIAKDAGAPVPGGGKLNFQMHYTTTGKASTDKTQVGFYTLKAPPKYIKRSTVVFDFGLQIPAGEARHKEVAYITTPADMYIYTLYPHSHYRGYHVELMQKDADGKESMLLSLPKYDFNWQRDYDPIEPILIKKGTKLIATWVFDNSTNNKKLNAVNKDSAGSPIASYNDVVRTGEQSHQEMMYFRINYRWADETVDNIRNDLQSQLMASMSFGMIDDNYDGMIQQSELKGMMASLKPRFKALDVDGSGALDPVELKASGLKLGIPEDAQIDL